MIPIGEIDFGDFETQGLYKIATEFPDSVTANLFLQIYRDSGVDVPEFLQVYLDEYVKDLQGQADDPGDADAQEDAPDSLPELPFDVQDVAPYGTLNFSEESLNTINELFEQEGLPPPEGLPFNREAYAPHPDSINPSPISLAFDAWAQANPDKTIRWKGTAFDVASFWDAHPDEASKQDFLSDFMPEDEAQSLTGQALDDAVKGKLLQQALLNDRVVQTVPEEMFDKEKFDIAFDSVYTRFQNDEGLVQAIEASKQGHGGNIGEDILMKVLFEGTGRDGLPQQISQEEFDAMAEQGALTMFRGIKGAQYMEQFKTGPLYYDKGAYGNGSYFAMDKKVAIDYAAGNKANVTEMILDPNAKIITYEALAEVQQQLLEMLQTEKVSRQYVDAMAEQGRLATVLGFDAIYVPGKEYLVVLDRSKLFYNK